MSNFLYFHRWISGISFNQGYQSGAVSLRFYFQLQSTAPRLGPQSSTFPNVSSDPLNCIVRFASQAGSSNNVYMVYCPYANLANLSLCKSTTELQHAVDSPKGSVMLSLTNRFYFAPTNNNCLFSYEAIQGNHRVRNYKAFISDIFSTHE